MMKTIQNENIIQEGDRNIEDDQSKIKMEPKNPLAQLKTSTESLYNIMNQIEDRNRLGGVGDKVKDLDQISKEQ